MAQSLTMVARKPKSQHAAEGLNPVAQGYKDHALYHRPLAFELNRWMLIGEAARMSAFVRRLRSLGLSKATGQYITLRDLYFAPDYRMTQREIMLRRGVSSANVTRWIHGLEREGLAVRTLDATERRATFVQLTPAGEKLCERLVPEIAQFISDVAEGFSDDELAHFTGFLKRLQADADKLSAEQPVDDLSDL